ncbi:hypothetical protein SAMN05216302_103619 [Nitrosomonas aestuarii]|uniref:Uncharacterized protein n=1 Tax=Nitrosomonas aestuarii TaxID=52441 RepID=A0A1I4FHF4_9PROT|nr:hypothetical protein SAMN05216302_103619 [Nitrosomonas aestuarii]
MNRSLFMSKLCRNLFNFVFPLIALQVSACSHKANPEHIKKSSAISTRLLFSDKNEVTLVTDDGKNIRKPFFPQQKLYHSPKQSVI